MLLYHFFHHAFFLNQCTARLTAPSSDVRQLCFTVNVTGRMLETEQEMIDVTLYFNELNIPLVTRHTFILWTTMDWWIMVLISLRYYEAKWKLNQTVASLSILFWGWGWLRAGVGPHEWLLLSVFLLLMPNTQWKWLGMWNEGQHQCVLFFF